ncbi:MAG: hypothetical protein DRO88_07795 [Promethearchaeia archaeon]|nr:MAG: hypothetical protein DRO88_07795 [Candidatus Lokiarchaeia archaeon]
MVQDSSISLKRLYKISNFSYNEAFLQSTLNMAGANQNQIMERLKKKSKYLKNQRLTSKIVMTIYLVLFIAVPIQSLMMVKDALKNGNAPQQTLLASSGLISAFLLMQIFYLLMFGLFTSTGLFSPDSYRWLSTLPIKKSNLPVIGLFTLFRGMNLQIVVLTLVFPTAVAIITANFVITLIALVQSILTMLFGISLLVLLGAKFTKIVNTNAGNNRISTISRIAVIMGYMLGTIMASLGIQLVNPIMVQFMASSPVSHEILPSLNQWLALIPVFLNAGYMVSAGFIGFSYFSANFWIFAGIGLVLFVVVNYRLAKRALRVFYKSIEPNLSEKTTVKISTLEDVSVQSTSQTMAFFKKDAQNITRDIQSLMFVVMPVILPLIAFLVTGITGIEEGEEMDQVVLYFLAMFYMFMGAFMLILGVISIETTGATILAALPIDVRAQAKAKILWTVLIIPFANLIPSFLFIKEDFFLEMLAVFGVMIPMGIIFAVFVLEMQAFFFGKLKYKYVLDEVKIEHKVGKIILMVIIGLVISISYIIAVAYLLNVQGSGYMLVYMGLIELVLGILVYLIFNKMFPKMQ